MPDNTVTKRHMVAVFLPLPASEPPSNSDGSAPVDPQDSLSDETRYGFKNLQDPDSDKRRMPCIDLAIGDSACPQKLPGPDFRFLDLIRTPGILSVVKIHALNIIAQCLATDLVAVIRRPSGFGLSTLASAVHHYFNGFDVGRERLPWELDPHYVPPNLLRGFTVLSLDLGDPSITSADGEQTLVAYLARELEKFSAPWDRILKNFPRREIKSVEDLGYAMVGIINRLLAEAILRTHGIKCLIIVDNYNHMEGPGPLGEEARKFTESLCQHARGGRLWAVLLGHIKGELDDLGQQWQEYPNRAHFALDVYDMTYSGSEAVQESMGLTLDEVNELALALGIPDVITSNSLEDRGIRGWVFSESERQWPVHYYTSIMPRKESTPRHVYSIARVFEFLRELQERQVVES
ncbi:hypothetical protein V5O48_003051 [Marasmius crinis-equi]|uniref:Uncharacterized protein n=1 Tax=Marasmius crinis-equi TaxID=585013 RepID=A0ABR3FTY5_9AGAR